MAEHTKGPWTLDADVGRWQVDAETWAGLAEVYFNDDHEGESEANAHLIAASPTMLEALVVFVFAADHAPGDMGEAVEKARKAIAKATGGSP